MEFSPKESERIFLWGLPASGKTTLGRQWAEKFDRPFIDLDEYIEARHGPIRDLFARYGQWGFRLRERAELRRLVNEFRGGIVAVGGGTPCYFDNADYMNAVGTTVWLNVAPETVAQRIKGGGRPLFNHGDPKEIIKKLFQYRIFFYQKAHKTYIP
jgi:shikimate kinase